MAPQKCYSRGSAGKPLDDLEEHDEVGANGLETDGQPSPREAQGDGGPGLAGQR